MNNPARQTTAGLEIFELLELAARSLPHRHPELFYSFLRRGYDLVRLPHADPRFDYPALVAKLALGCIITAIDDLADHPKKVDAHALERASALVLSTRSPIAPESELECLLVTLRQEMFRRLEELPRYQCLAQLFSFDLAQIVLANSYHQLLTQTPTLANATEMRQYGAYNMGMIAAHLIDLMTLRNYRLDSLGRDREVFYWGQRYGRIANMLTTKVREAQEGDLTNELLNPATATDDAHLEAEAQMLLKTIESAQGASFDGRDYATGLRKLYALHQDLAGRL